MAPILSFTAEEAWTVLHGEDASVFFHTFDDAIPAALGDERALLDKWTRVREIRAEAMKALEYVRAEGKIGSGLQASLTVKANPGDAALLQSLGNDLKFVFITSQVTVEAANALHFSVVVNTDPKCERCWHQSNDVGSHSDYPHICGRCVTNLSGAGEARAYA
jgi:isoleucyl-tRNA synthetase